MYAVIQTGGKQYKVAVGDKLKVEKLAAAEGDSVNIPRVLMVADGDKITVGTPLAQTEVSATVLGHGRGEKIRVFKMKRRKDYRRTQGHRQSYTEIQITAIGDHTEKVVTAAAAKKVTKKTAAKKTTAKKTATKKTTTKKTVTKTPAKKATTKKSTTKKTTAKKTTKKKTAKTTTAKS